MNELISSFVLFSKNYITYFCALFLFSWVLFSLRLFRSLKEENERRSQSQKPKRKTIEKVREKESRKWDKMESENWKWFICSSPRVIFLSLSLPRLLPRPRLIESKKVKKKRRRKKNEVRWCVTHTGNEKHIRNRCAYYFILRDIYIFLN